MSKPSFARWESFLREKVRDQERELNDAASYEATLEQRLQDLQSDNEMLRANLEDLRHQHNWMIEYTAEVLAEKDKLESEVEQLKATLKGV